jgi:hypothetical protein
MEEKLLDARIKVLLIAAYSLSGSFVAVVLALIVGLFTPNELVDNEKVFTLLSYIVTAVAGAITGGYAAMMGFKADKQEAPDMAASVDAPVNVSVVNDLDADKDDESKETFFAKKEEPAMELDEPFDENGDGELQPWEIHRHDLRYDANGDGVVDENDFPDWRNPNK